MKVLRHVLGAVRFEGVGGHAMAREGLTSLFPIEELSIIGLTAVLRQLPKVLRLIRRTVDAILHARPDILVIIDSPDFTHRVARRVRARDPDHRHHSTMFRPRSGPGGRAGRVDAGLYRPRAGSSPFEPDEYRRLRGPPCSYVGHPLTEQLSSLRPGAEETKRRSEQPPVLLLLPGSRRSELRRHMTIFGETLGRLRGGRRGIRSDPSYHAASSKLRKQGAGIHGWSAPGSWLVQEARSIPMANTALAKSGTVTLELALARAPMTAPPVATAEAWISRRAINVKSVIFANLVIGKNAIPEFVQEDCTPGKLFSRVAGGPRGLAAGGMPAAAFAGIGEIMSTGNQPPFVCAAEIVLVTLQRPRRIG